MTMRNVTNKVVALYNSYLKNMGNRSSVKSADIKAGEFAAKGYDLLSENLYEIPSIRY